MVKIFFTVLLFFSISFAEEISVVNPIVNPDDLLTQKIKSFIDSDVYEKNKKFIEIIFSPKSEFYNHGSVNVVKVIATLKDNGLLKLFFNSPKTLKLHFKTYGSPLFFVKLMSDSLRNMGYYRYVTTSSNFDSLEFTWSISLTSEYATDPLILQKELMKSGCKIVDIEHNDMTEWTYVVDMVDGFLNIPLLRAQERVSLKRSLYAHWLNVSQVQKLIITSSWRNHWYPYIAFYDSSLGLIKVLKRDKRSHKVVVRVPKFAKYIKISDIYTLKNLKDKLSIDPVGEK